MPYDTSGHGYNGETTETKQDRFAKLAAFHLDWTHKVLRNHTPNTIRYRYWDLTAGSGESNIYGDGSPVIQAKAAEAYRATHDNPMWIRAHLIEQEEETARQLNRTAVINQDLMLCRPLYDSEIYAGSYQDVMPDALFWHQRLGQFPYYGMAYLDPSGEIPDFELLGTLNQYHPRLDILIHFSATNIKRVRRSPMTRLTDDLISGLQIIGKREWKIAHLGSKHQWCFVFGTNYDKLGDWKKIGLYSINSTKGREILEAVNYTNEEKAERKPMEVQPTLWKL